ncbi:MAG TPA: hypothetical protein VEA16_03100 [Vicinamibacterales bacterium]|nr:hypothetical protein [Vicinamibacterales bacterium]
MNMAWRFSKYARYAVTALWIIGGGYLAGATAAEARRAWMVVPRPAEVVREVIIRDVKDDEGLKTTFRIMLFSDEFRWRINSFDQLEHPAKRPQFTPGMKAVLNTAKEIITVGASSEEIPLGMPFPEGRAREEKRAARRAERIAVWVREALDEPIPIRKLNVGHHAPTGAGDTSDQRRVIIILVLSHEEGANIDQALRRAMAGESVRAPIFEALVSKYSLGNLDAFTWVP